MDESPPDAPAAAWQRLFTPEEWVAVFPAAPPPLSPLPGVPRPVDPAAAVRAADPLSAAAMERAMRPVPSLHLVTRLQFGLDFLRPLQAPRYAALGILGGACAFLVPVFNDGTFATPQLAVGTAIVGFAFLSQAVFPLASWGRAEPTASFYGVFYSGAVRWLQLVEAAWGEGTLKSAASGGSGTDEVALEEATLSAPRRTLRLLQHDPDDPACPCPDPACAGSLLSSAGWIRLAEIATRFAWCMASQFSFQYTVLVTFAGDTWANWWSAAMAGLAMAAAVGVDLEVIPSVSTNAPLEQLYRRVRSRAVREALGELLAKCGEMVAAGQGVGPSPPEAEAGPGIAEAEDVEAARQEAYNDLHAGLAASWKSPPANLNFPISTLIQYLLALAVWATAYMVSGGCVPAFIPLQIGYLFLSLFLDLVNMAAHNSQIADAVDLYRDAQRELRELALPARLSRNATALAALRGHDLVLSSYIEADRLRARILGFGVDYGLVRTLFVTVFTLAFGLWSILRGFGVVVTMDTVCRSG